MDGITDWDNLSDELKTTISVNNAVSNRFYRELEEEIMTPQDLEKEYTTEELANDVNTYIADVCAELPKTKEKFLKQKFLKNIPCPMTQEEFVDYATYSLDGVNDKLVSLVAYGNIFEIVDALEKQEHEHGDSCDCGHEHHHEHGHDCSCGHEHHHEHGHDCGCGHEHHHEHGHDCGCGHHHH